MTETPRDVEYLSTEELVTELLSRGDAVVVAMREKNTLPGMNRVRRRWTGNAVECLELCAATGKAIVEKAGLIDSDQSAQEGDYPSPRG